MCGIALRLLQIVNVCPLRPIQLMENTRILTITLLLLAGI